MQKFAAYITGLAAIVPMFAITFDQAINLSSRWINDRAAVIVRLVDIHTDDESGTFAKESYEANVREIQKFVDLVK
jgi:hypothetical protein